MSKAPYFVKRLLSGRNNTEYGIRLNDGTSVIFYEGKDGTYGWYTYLGGKLYANSIKTDKPFSKIYQLLKDNAYETIIELYKDKEPMAV